MSGFTGLPGSVFRQLLLIVQPWRSRKMWDVKRWCGKYGFLGGGRFVRVRDGMSDVFPYDVFLSHSAKDKGAVCPRAERRAVERI